MLHDFAFYGSASWIAIFLALILMGIIEELLRTNRRWRFSIRNLFVAMTLVAVVLGIFSVILRK